MPENIKALFAILAFGIIFFHQQRKNLASVISKRDFDKWRFLWFSITLIAFLSHDYWLFAIGSFCVIKINVTKKSADQFTYFLWLLPCLPFLPKEIPFFGGVRFLFELNFPRLLSLSLLLPIFLIKSNPSTTFFRLRGDKIIFLYLVLNSCLAIRNGGEITNILRSDFYLFTDIFLPYYAASRSLIHFTDYQKSAFAIFSSMLIIASISIAETLKGWHLHATLSNSLDINQVSSSYLMRENILRATGPFSSPIILGYMLTIGMGMGLAITHLFKSRIFLILAFLIYSIALLATLSRGPWVGAAALGCVYILLSPKKGKIIFYIIFTTIILAPFAISTAIGQKFISLLPFIGHSESANHATITYREELFNKAWIVIQRKPWFGSNDYLNTAEMQSMIQGQGIIDIVNSYLRIALNSGFVGLGLFTGFFINLLMGLFQTLKKIPPRSIELHMFAKSLLATMISVLLIIATVSSIEIISFMYWILAGITSGYLYFLKHHSLNSKNKWEIPNNEMDTGSTLLTKN